jgi:hypothetical protein
MPKRFSETDKREWLELYETGKSEKWIARERARCDPRTVKRGIDEARHRRDANMARLELVKNAFSKHQDDLLGELKNILSSLTMPPVDIAVLSWHHDGDSIFTVDDKTEEMNQKESTITVTKKVNIGHITKRDLLKEHLKNDRLWKKLAQRETDYNDNTQARIALQHKIVNIIEKQTGYKFDDGKKLSANFICSYTTGDLFFKSILQKAFGIRPTITLEEDIYADVSRGEVQYQRSILAQVAENQEGCKENLLIALRKLQRSKEINRVVETQKALAESNETAKQVVELLLLLNFVPGQCQVCRLLGI